MKLFAPDYYKEFACIADKCRHSCCVGWEIDIDANTFEYYKSVQGDFGRCITDEISAENGMPHFILSDEERCPFLNKNNLCDIILKLGSDSLCQICSDHPRYRNFFSDRTEIGLGLCCEAAAELVLSRGRKMELVLVGDDSTEEFLSEEEEIFFDVRGKLFEIIQNREISIDSRVNELLSGCDIELPQKSAFEWAGIYLGLEHLDFEWVKRLEELQDKKPENISLADSKWDTAFEQLLIYFLYRHTADALNDGRFKERVAFSVLGFYMIRVLFYSCDNRTLEELTEIARMYSSEIEYCEENIETLIGILERE